MAEPQQGTEYTLQGVMRFLQIEWQNHERSRNSWDIERAEMKARIAKQEGDCRSAKKLNELLEKQVKMLEKALAAERAKNRSASPGQPRPTEEEVKSGWDGRIGLKPSDALPGVDVDQRAREAAELEREAQRDKSKVFMQKCVEELTYLLTPPSHPLPPQSGHMMNGSDFGAIPDMTAAMPEAHLPHSQAMAQNRRRNMQLSSLPSLPNNHHQPPQRPTDSYSAVQMEQEKQELMNKALEFQQEPANPESLQSQQPQLRLSNPDEEDVERVTHAFDAYGRPLPNEEAESRAVEDTNGWNFDDSSALLEPLPGVPPPRIETDQFPSSNNLPSKSPPRAGHGSHRRKSSGAGSGSRRRSTDGKHEIRDLNASDSNGELGAFKARYILRGHLDVVRSVIFTGGGSPSEPEICTTGDDGTIKRWIIPATNGTGALQSQNSQQGGINEPDVQAYFTHRGHDGIVTSLSVCRDSPSFSTGGRALGDGWVFSGGQDATIRVWERGRVDPKATLDGHTDAVWSVCVLAANASSVLNSSGGSQLNTVRDDRILLASGAADNTVKIWAVSGPPQLTSPSNPTSGSRRGVGGTRRHSVTSGSGFPSTPQPSTASDHPFAYQLIHNIDIFSSSPTCISPLSASGESFVVSFADAGILIFDTRTAESVIGMASNETYDGTPATGVNSVVVAGTGVGSFERPAGQSGGEGDDEVHGATGTRKSGGIEGTVISGHEDRFVRFFDANSGQCTYSMLAHPSSIASLSLSPDGRELMTAGHDASLRFWSLEKRSCSQEITSHRPMRGEGITSAVWSQDGKWVVSVGGDGAGKVFGR